MRASQIDYWVGVGDHQDFGRQGGVQGAKDAAMQTIMEMSSTEPMVCEMERELTCQVSSAMCSSNVRFSLI